MLTPIGIIRIAARAAMRRRYAYAALRVVRSAVRRALQEHRRRELDARPYSVTSLDIRRAYFDAMRRLRGKWPHWNPNDPRAEP